MPEESKGPESVSPPPEGTQPQAEKPAPASAEVSEAKPVAPPQGAARETKSADASKPAAPAAKPADAAKPTPATANAPKPTAVAAAKPASAPSDAAKPPAAAAAKPAAPAAAKPAVPAKPAGPLPQPWNSELVADLKKQYGSGIKETSSYVGQNYLVVDSSIVFEILRRMRDEQLYDYCVDITAVHWPKREQQFDIVYVLYSFHYNTRVRIKTLIKEGEHVQSAVNLWPTANWLEREVFDMFGIVFDGHPDLKRILLPDGWKGYPLRKDYDILLQDKEWVQINLGIESGQ